MDIDLREVAVGGRVECSGCGETLVRVKTPVVPETEDIMDRAFRELASGDKHDCWEDLPDDSEHLRLD